MSTHLGDVEAILIGALQGVTELFPVSSLGHSVILPALIGGRWAADLNVSAHEPRGLSHEDAARFSVYCVAVGLGSLASPCGSSST
jgi:undecaprenyl pyrophosphate phosphatase UppP